MNADNRGFAAALATLAADERLWRDFLAFCDCGGRLAGTPSEKTSLTLARRLLEEIDRRGTRLDTVSYAGWRRGPASLTLEDSGAALACHALVGSQSTDAAGFGTNAAGVGAEVLDLGRGTQEDFDKHSKQIAGRIAMVRHEYMFATGHIHRRRKYGWAMERGAAGFIIANPFGCTGTVCGSSGRGGQAGIPAVATDYDSALKLMPDGSKLKRVRLCVAGEDVAAETSITVLEIPGMTPSWVVLSAHLDGHDLAESAMDNASGAAVAIAVARVVAPLAANCRRGLRLCLFSAEEWALAGSRQYLDSMTDAQRGSIALNINLDTVGGDSKLTALTSEFPALNEFVREAGAAAGMNVGTYLPLMPNSDHFSFARHGIPALRLVAGFDTPSSNVRYVLTAADTRDKVVPEELQGAAKLTATLLWNAMNAGDAEIAALGDRT